MRKTHHGQVKRQGGLSLVPALWEVIQGIADAAGVPKNQVIENALMREFLPDGVSQKSIESVQNTDEELVNLK